MRVTRRLTVPIAFSDLEPAGHPHSALTVPTVSTGSLDPAVSIFTPAPVSPLTVAELRARWHEQSASAGWLFSSDWHDPAVDAVCEACLRGAGLWAAAERFGAVRAAAGASLGETLADVDGLTAVLPDMPSDVLFRAVSLGWADRVPVEPATVFDPLTGLVSLDYLRVRLGETYRAAEVEGRRAGDEHSLVVVRVDLTGRTGWDRLTPLILAGDAMRSVFSGGQTLARLSHGAAVALTTRDDLLPRRAQLLGDLVTERMLSDGPLAAAPPRVWIERLPSTLRAAGDLVGELGR